MRGAPNSEKDVRQANLIESSFVAEFLVVCSSAHIGFHFVIQLIV